MTKRELVYVQDLEWVGHKTATGVAAWQAAPVFLSVREAARDAGNLATLLRWNPVHFGSDIATKELARRMCLAYGSGKGPVQQVFTR